jgi:hypothetical protein
MYLFLGKSIINLIILITLKNAILEKFKEALKKSQAINIF